MAIRTGSAEWTGSIKDGAGRMKAESGNLDAPYSIKTRMEDQPGSNPEELIGAAHAGCFSMAMAAALSKAGTPPTKIETSAKVHLEQKDGGWVIPLIELTTKATIPGMEDATFQALAAQVKQECPVSKVLSGAEIRLTASLG